MAVFPAAQRSPRAFRAGKAKTSCKRPVLKLIGNHGGNVASVAPKDTRPFIAFNAGETCRHSEHVSWPQDVCPSKAANESLVWKECVEE